jgi:hypothetical protein
MTTAFPFAVEEDEMMQSLNITRQSDSSLRAWIGALRPWLVNRWVLAIAGLAVVGSGLALGWSWLTAIGVAPLVVSTAPCLVMCAFGACAMCRRSPGAVAPSVVPTDPPSAVEN